MKMLLSRRRRTLMGFLVSAVCMLVTWQCVASDEMPEITTAAPGTGDPSTISPSASDNIFVAGKQFWERHEWTATTSMGGLIRMCFYIFLALFAFVVATPWRKAATEHVQDLD
jgi:hypothetical protein